MTTKSNKNFLMIILISSVVLFAAAIIWNNSQESNEEVVNVPTQPVEKKVKKKKKKDLKFLEDEFVEPSSSEAETMAANKATRKKLSNVMQMTMIYKTPEQVMESVIYYQETGNEDKVNELIEFLLERFPDYEIPKDL